MTAASFVILMSASMGKRTAAVTASTLSTEGDVQKKHADYGLLNSVSNQSGTTGITVDETVQRTYITANPDGKTSSVFPSHTKTLKTVSSFVHSGRRHNATTEDTVYTSKGLTAVSNTIPVMVPSMSRQDECDAMLCETNVGRFLLNTSACTDDEIPSINAFRSFTISVMTDSEHGKNIDSRCEWEITPDRNHYMKFSVGRLPRSFIGHFYIYIKETDHMGFVINKMSVYSRNLKTTNFSFLSVSSIHVRFDSSMPHQTEAITLHVVIKKGTYLHHLPVVMLSDTVGYITSPGYDENQKYPNKYDGSYHLTVAVNESLLVNFITLHLEDSVKCANDYLHLVQKAQRIRWTYCRWKKNIMVRVFYHPVDISFHTNSNTGQSGFKMMFVTLPRSQEPRQLPNKLFNCSVPNFYSFKPVFSCTLLVECYGGEDEQDCGHRQNTCGIKDTLDAGTKCYSLVLHQGYMTWFDAHKECIRRGQKLATMEHPDDFRLFKAQVPPVVKLRGYFVGAQLMVRQHALSITALYTNIWQWVDGRTVFSVQIYDYYKNNGSCALYYPWLLEVTSISCHETRKSAAYVCEFYKQRNDPPVTDINASANLTRTSSNIWNVIVVQCSLNHVTRDFLSCDFRSNCGASHSVTSCSVGDMTIPMFVCERSRSTVHYTLVCDYMQHCSDNSDEEFCKYPACSTTSMKCRNGQCIDSYYLCDGKLDCIDGSDEVCQPKRYIIETTAPPGSVYLDGRGNFRMARMKDSDECPPTHFQCPHGFCLPVYLRCNGVVDCVGREDEVGCSRYKCRGFYRCRGSRACLHPEHVCNGIPQCPEQDDELLCDLVCPEECRCQGLAFVCSSNFSATSHLTLRYLDSSGSNMTLNDVSDNFHLIVIRMSKCRISSLPSEMTFPNLKELDISWNELYQLHMQYFHSLKNLNNLVLTGNPLVRIVKSKPESVKLILDSLDLSHTRLEQFNSSEFSNMPHLKSLNISWSKLRSIKENGFQSMPLLESIDLRGIRLINFPKTLLRYHTLLRSVYSENYKLCCVAMLPVHFDIKNCHTVQDLLASCDDLLKSNPYRVFLWIFASLSLVGNVFSVVAKLYQQKQGGGFGSFNVFVTNLCVADFFMGVYLVIIGMADLVYRGSYLWRDNEWKNSAACNIAGFLCLLSSETSAFIICLITLDRFLVLRFPFSRLHFGRRSALSACGVVWSVGVSIATIPLLPVTSQWKFYSQTGICIPLPFTSSQSFLGYGYSFGVSILLNLVLFLLIAVGQAIVYQSVRANSLPSSTNTRARDAAIARRLIIVVVSDFLCWFPIGLLGLLASTGTPIPGYLNVAVATFVLPVNSALNPFLYTFNLLMEKRRKAETEKLLKRLEQGRRDQVKVLHNISGKSVNKTAVIQQIKTWILERMVTPDDLLSFLPTCETS